MRYAIFSDIHSNFEALQAIWKKLTSLGFDQTICLGDVVGYGPDPVACINFLREHEIVTIKGNHDHYTASNEPASSWEMQDYAAQSIVWTQSQIDLDQMNWLRHLPYVVKHDSIQFVHASMETMEGEFWPYILDKKRAQFHFYLQDCNIAFFGHTHIPLFFSSSCGEIIMEILKPKVLPLNFTKFLINPGAVRQPRDGDCRAAALILETDTRTVTPIRVSYPVEITCKKIIAAGLPATLANKLSRGC